MRRPLAEFGAVLAGALLLIAAAAPESRLEQYFRLRTEAAAAVKSNDLVGAEARLEAALALYPTSPGSLIRLARVETAAGKPEEAIAHLAAYANFGLTWDVAGDPALKALVDRADFTPVAARLKTNADPVGAPREIATLGPAGAVYEGIVRVDGGWVLSSVAGRSLLRRTEDGQLETLLSPDAETGGLFGMAVSPDGKGAVGRRIPRTRHSRLDRRSAHGPAEGLPAGRPGAGPPLRSRRRR